ncbi:hypothetical protein V7O62_08125 [Methanolobus sp. ZRKC2]|uniref:hypothetical protein n=1 Tax=Methanolobus sp. ZRKC2 TaxID=3125783 RepID=UPI0032524311
MSFIEKIFGKKRKEVETGPVRFEFNKLSEMVKQEYEKELGTLRPVIGKKYKEIGISIKEIKDVKKSLLEAEAIANANKRAEKLGDSNRDNIAHNLDLIIEKIRIPSNNEPGNAFAFYEDSKSVLKNVLDNTRRSQMYIKALYPREFERINLAMANLEARLDELFALIRNKKNKIDAFEKIPEHVENVRENERHMEQSRKKILDFESRYESAKKELANTDASIEKLEESSEFEETKALENEIRELKNKIASVDSEVKRLFTPMSKALSRMEKQDKNEMYVLSPENREVLRKIKDNPISIQVEELESFLNVLEERIENRDLGLKEQMYEKILKQIEKLKDPATMSDLHTQREQYLAEIEELTEKLNLLHVYKNREDLEKQIAKCNDSIGVIISDMEAEQRHLEDLEGQLEDSRYVLNSEIKDIFGNDAQIVY